MDRLDEQRERARFQTFERQNFGGITKRYGDFCRTLQYSWCKNSSRPPDDLRIPRWLQVQEWWQVGVYLSSLLIETRIEFFNNASAMKENGDLVPWVVKGHIWKLMAQKCSAAILKTTLWTDLENIEKKMAAYTKEVSKTDFGMAEANCSKMGNLRTTLNVRWYILVCQHDLFTLKAEYRWPRWMARWDDEG